MKGCLGMAEGQSGTAACSAEVCDDLTSGALLCHYRLSRLSRLSCYMVLLLPFLLHNKARFPTNDCLNVDANHGLAHLVNISGIS